MVKVKVLLKQDRICEIKVSDHAQSGIHGQDLICAGVSAICVGILNTLNELYEDVCELVMSEAYVEIINKDILNDDVQLILRTMYIQLLTMEKNYGRFIKITKVEV